ncbi:hypothetical protein ITP53_09255 [Nonomuraea sp. K274]|uniref:Secreted protein n=1 Tax=Nonomuraea cypriaca TaxID=1187855 RepID=A0A931EVR8_9ACTN|nr:hypothetical protein [Nonomuraea cypriaca]MBF8185929.1 hypothetical protein [Nonomuraea cypriaca]
MPTRSAAVLTSGTANAARLFVAALAFTSAYVGFSAYNNAGSAAAEPPRTVTLAARDLPITEQITEPITVPAKAGEVFVSLVTGGADCLKTYVARGVVVNAGQSVAYGWKLTRWSPATKTWRTYLVEYDGFAGDAKTVEWRPQVTGNPGWYRVELTAEGAKTVRSERFQVSC